MEKYNLCNKCKHFDEEHNFCKATGIGIEHFEDFEECDDFKKKG